MHFLGNQQKSSYSALAYHEPLLLFIFFHLQVYMIVIVSEKREIFFMTFFFFFFFFCGNIRNAYTRHLRVNNTVVKSQGWGEWSYFKFLKQVFIKSTQESWNNRMRGIHAECNSVPVLQLGWQCSKQEEPRMFNFETQELSGIPKRESSSTTDRWSP